MGEQSVRQRARRAALDAQARVRAEHAERDRRWRRLAVQVVQALAERDATVTACEQRAGTALRQLTTEEGLTLREATAWCGPTVTTREAARLRRLVPNSSDEPAAPSGNSGDQEATTTPVAASVVSAGE